MLEKLYANIVQGESSPTALMYFFRERMARYRQEPKGKGVEPSPTPLCILWYVVAFTGQKRSWQAA